MIEPAIAAITLVSPPRLAAPNGANQSANNLTIAKAAGTDCVGSADVPICAFSRS